MIKVELDTIPIEVQTLRVPRFRGAAAKPIIIRGLDKTYAVIQAHIQGRDTVTLTVTAPNNPGPSQNDIVVKVGPLLVNRLTTIQGGTMWELELFDRRMLLATRVCIRDFNIQNGLAPLPGTEAADSVDALKKFCDDIDLIKAELDPNAFASLTAVGAPRDLALAGHNVITGVEVLGEKCEADIDVTIGGKFRFASKGDIGAAGGKLLAQLISLPWENPPPFLKSKTIRRNLPAQVRVMFTERCSVLLFGTSDVTTIASPTTGPLRLELEQVYVESGRYFTLSELVLELFGSAQTGISDAIIASCIMTETLENCRVNGQPLQLDNDQTRRFIAAIKNGWRVLWRLDPVNTEFGGWTDHSFGFVRIDGSLDPNPVVCKWVEFFRVIGASAGTFIGAAASENRDAPSPFIPDWDSGPESRVIRLNPGRATPHWGDFKAGELQHAANVAVPGVLINPLKVNANIVAINDGQGNSYPLKQFRPVEIENPSKARFQPRFALGIYMTMTRRAPQSQDRFHKRDLPGVQGGTQARHEMYVPELLCYRSAPVSATLAQELGIQQINPQADGLGAVLNDTALLAEANRAVDKLMREQFLEAEGEGVVESIRAFRDLVIDGPIESVTMELDTEEDGAKLRTRIVFGNSGSARARNNREVEAPVVESRQDAGKFIV